jgi:DNA-binding transcriptional ArsR family regulator
LILYSLRRKGRTLEEISRSLKIAQKAVLAELKALQNSHMLISASRSTEVIYSLADKRILPALELIHKVSQRKFQHATINNNVSSTSAHSGGRQA